MGQSDSSAQLKQGQTGQFEDLDAPVPTQWQRFVRFIRPPTKSGVSVSPEMLLLCAVVYGVLVFCIGNAFLPGHPAFATLVIWICSVVGAEIAHFLRIPRVVGMLGTGLLLANVPGGVIAAFPKRWGVQMRAAALGTIFLRCGLELEFKTMALYKWPALRLAFIPGVTEAFFDAGVAHAVFGMPFTMALSLGFILKAVGPGLVVPAMFQLQKQGWGANKGIPSTVVIAASFDDIIAITGFSIFINVAIATGDDAAWMIASGPLQVIFGMLGGIIAGAVLGSTKFFNNRFKRLVGIYGAALLIMFFLEYHDMLSGGALGSLTTGLVTCYMWEHGKLRKLSIGPTNAFSADIERVLAVIWNWVMEPMLFATIGSSIVFKNLPADTIPNAVLVVCTGLCLRTIATFVVMGGRRYTWKERLFYSVAWTPKATVQASLSAVPLALINSSMAGQPEYEQYVKWGNDILATGIFGIIICATLGTLLVYWLAPVLLEHSEEASQEACKMSRATSRIPTKKPSAFATAFFGSRAHSMIVSRTQSLGVSRTQSNQMSDLVDPAAVVHELHEAEEHNIINDYFDSIEKLIALVLEGRGAEAKDEGLCNTVLHLQEAIARDVGPRELTVRQMLHSAALRSRQPALTAGDADNLVRLHVTSGSGSDDEPARQEHPGGSSPGGPASGLPLSTIHDLESGSHDSGSRSSTPGAPHPLLDQQRRLGSQTGRSPLSPFRDAAQKPGGE